MDSSSGSFPVEFADIGLKEIIESIPNELPVREIVELGCGSGRVGLAVWKHYSEIATNEPVLFLIDADRTWFDDHISENTDNDTFQKACKDFGLRTVPDTIHYITSDIFNYLKSTENKYDLILMRSVLQFIDNVDELFYQIQKAMTTQGVFVHACLAFPSQESKQFYDELTEKILERSTKGSQHRKLHTVDEVRSITNDYFNDVEETAQYILRADSEYTAKRFGLSCDQAKYLRDEVLPHLLKKYPTAGACLNLEINKSDFRIDVPYRVLRGYRCKI